ncbi:zinc-finger domain-containing protein [Lederbergia lenta]|uniref:Protein of uncharacterized function (DUF2602) n=1 Tax=Lederbergia lenta TaxID=1467 RepID=A0A2X4VXE0_LEDLE|nr:zinc-finger domain-containing protein [Lederbergia lenta]MCM3109333.1 zinc-finger domain-containing protein [Lederbergia lenta]MEC2324901.1 zinc-finger domain-containing protein [Lederbergia lenta]SQI56676.1 Protein of uncharacterised function (DUF2602) [Lederbergia lenta]
MKRCQIIKEIDELLSTYCEGCFLKTYHRKTYSKAQAHTFCIKQCTVGKHIQTKGKTLLK